MMRPIRLRRLLAAACLTTGLVTVAPAGIAQAAVAFASTMVNQANGNCATVPGGAGTSALQLTQSTCSSATSQRFSFTPVSGDVYTISTLTAGSCVDIFGASSSDNSAVIQYACHSGTNQQFRLQSVGTSIFNVIAVHSGKCVVPAGDSSANNAALVQLPCTTATSRTWRLPGFTSGGGTGTTFTNPLSMHGPDPWLQYTAHSSS